MSVGIRFFAWLSSQFVGVDSYGNRYYCSSVHLSRRRRVHRRRWVLYKGTPEASKIPPEWHVWLHYTVDAPLNQVGLKVWQRGHLPNPTGTQNRYLPPGHEDHGISQCNQAVGGYEAWCPE